MVLALVIRGCVVGVCMVPTPSMEQTLLPGDFLLFDKFGYGFRTPPRIPFTSIPLPSWRVSGFLHPHHGDVVVFSRSEEGAHPGESISVEYVKRCVALPGDTVALSPGGVVVVPKKGDCISLLSPTIERWKSLIQREGHTVASDGRGRPIIDGRLESSYCLEHDYYYVLGDNRENSFDSRSWGFVPDDAIIGKALLIYWSREQQEGDCGFWKQVISVRWNRIGTMIH